MNETTRGPVGRFLKTLCGAVSLLTVVSAAGSPVLAARHSHPHFHHFSRGRHHSHWRRRRSVAESHSSHAARLASYSARAGRVEAQNVALHSGSIVQAATAFQGTRYVFGGTSRSGFDCSGFTRYILGASAGVDLPRTAMEQYYNGRSVDRGSLQPGDLVFFKNTYRHGISHVGIYIGDGHFVHASNESRGVTTDSLDAPYYAHHYAGARRVVLDREDAER